MERSKLNIKFEFNAEIGFESIILELFVSYFYILKNARAIFKRNLFSLKSTILNHLNKEKMSYRIELLLLITHSIVCLSQIGNYHIKFNFINFANKINK